MGTLHTCSWVSHVCACSHTHTQGALQRGGASLSKQTLVVCRQSEASPHIRWFRGPAEGSRSREVHVNGMPNPVYTQGGARRNLFHGEISTPKFWTGKDFWLVLRVRSFG